MYVVKINMKALFSLPKPNLHLLLFLQEKVRMLRSYLKNLKILDTRKICCNHPKFEQGGSTIE